MERSALSNMPRCSDRKGEVESLFVTDYEQTDKTHSASTSAFPVNRSTVSGGLLGALTNTNLASR